MYHSPASYSAAQMEGLGATRPSSSSGASSYLVPPPLPRASYGSEQPRSTTSTFRIPTPTSSYSSRSYAQQDYSTSSSYYLPAESSSSSAMIPPPRYDNYAYASTSSRPHTSYTPSSSYPPPFRQPVMSTTSSLLNADLDFDQYRRNSEEAGSVHSDVTYYGEDSGYAAVGTADEQIVGFAPTSRHSSFSAASTGCVDSYPTSSGVVPSSLSSSYHCQLCGWTTALSENFNTHLRAHDGDCLFQCFLDGCEAAFSDTTGLLAHTRRHRPTSADSANGNKRSWQPDDEVDQWAHTPQQPHKKACVEPITPITPSMYGSGAAVQQQQPRAVMPTISRTLSYDHSPPQPPPLPRHNSYDGVFTANPAQPDTVPSSSAVVSTFTIPSTPGSATSSNSGFVSHPSTSSPVFLDAAPSGSHAHQSRRQQLLASPLPLHATSSAPVDRGQFDPYPQSLLPSSTSMSVSHSLPPPPDQQQQQQQFSTPPRGRTIHSRRREQQQQVYDGEEQGQYFSQEGRHEFLNPHQLSSPISPAGMAAAHQPPALIPIPSSVAQSASHNSPRRPSSSSSATYTPSQAALVNAASMNRLLARLPPPASPYQQDSSPSSPLAPSYTASPTSASASTSTTTTNPITSMRGVNAVHPRYREPAHPSPYNIAASIRARTEEKIHACEEEGCGKRFKRLEHLKRHERTHTAEKPFMCDVPGCERYFSRSDNLQQHRKTHEKNGKTARAMAAAAAARAAAQVAAEMSSSGGSGGGGVGRGEK